MNLKKAKRIRKFVKKVFKKLPKLMYGQVEDKPQLPHRNSIRLLPKECQRFWIQWFKREYKGKKLDF